MLNEAQVEGLVAAGGWSYGDTCFVRIAVYRDPTRPRKTRPVNDRQDEPDYLTLRCEGQVALSAGALWVGDRIRAHGTIVTRDYNIPLTRFANAPKNAQGERATGPAVMDLQRLSAEYGRALFMLHSVTEVYTERLQVLLRAEAKDREPELAIGRARGLGNEGPHRAPRPSHDRGEPARAGIPAAPLPNLAVASSAPPVSVGVAA